MIAWWTNLDMEIVCNHEKDSAYLQNGDGNSHISVCPKCGQEYYMQLTVFPIEEIEIPAARLEILEGDIFKDKGFGRHLIWCFAKRFDIRI